MPGSRTSTKVPRDLPSDSGPIAVGRRRTIRTMALIVSGSAATTALVELEMGPSVRGRAIEHGVFEGVSALGRSTAASKTCRTTGRTGPRGSRRRVIGSLKS